MKISILVIALISLIGSVTFADDATQKSLTEALSKFTLPEMPDELKQKLRDYVPNDLKRRRDEGNARSTAEWEKISTREEWEAFRKEKVKLLRESLGVSFRTKDWKPPQLNGNVETTGTIKGEGYRIDKLLYRSSYGVWISANLYMPDPLREKMPGFIISHAHHTPKENGELQDMGTLWARAGCYVLVPDHLGHGERRQHPFKSKDDYSKPFQVSRQDYYFRYDVNLQLNLVGESLMGCFALDLMTGVSLLHGLQGIDKGKIILLGAVAGGGDPCAVTAALDERITCAAPFNFGGPQPETKYPLPEGVDFNYGGSGGWESTRNLAYSYRDGFLPWVIVGSIAPRRLIYGHEFAWDREHDPVWKRLEKIYSWYDKPDHLSFTHGHGTLTSKDPPGSHCTHIGKTHRKQMHVALAKWFDIQLPGGEESTERRDSSELRCWNDELREKLKPEPLHLTLRKMLEDSSRSQSAFVTVVDFTRKKVEWQSEPVELGGARAQQWVINYAEDNRLLPLLILKPSGMTTRKPPGVLVVTRAGKERFVRERAELIAELLAAGISIALPDLYNSGLTGPGADLGRRSSNTGRSSTLAMFGSDMVKQQVQDCYTAFDWLEKHDDWDLSRFAVLSDSLAPPNPQDVKYRIPRDDDSQMPLGPDPLPARVARDFAALPLATSTNGTSIFTKVGVLYSRGSLDSLASALDQHLVLLPHDAVPFPTFSHKGLDLSDTISLRQDQVVDSSNREVAAKDKEDHDPKTAAAWIIKQHRMPQK